jgi:hypothetical protein
MYRLELTLTEEQKHKLDILAEVWPRWSPEKVYLHYLELAADVVPPRFLGIDVKQEVAKRMAKSQKA